MKDCTHEWIEHHNYLRSDDWDNSFVPPPIPYPVTRFKGWSSTLVHCHWCEEIGYRIEATP